MNPLRKFRRIESRPWRGAAGLVVIGALAGGMHATALAQAQANAVTIYGILDVNLRIDRASSGTLKSVGSGLSRGSRLGFLAQEDMGGGLQALALIESGLNVDDGQMLSSGAPASGWGRQAFVALRLREAGMLSLGRQYTPMFAFAAGAVDIHGANYLGTANTTLALQGGLTARASNSLVYSYGHPRAMNSPSTRNGFSAAAMWGLGEAPDGSRAGDYLSMAASYGSGAWFAGYGAQVRRGSAAANPPATSPRQTSQMVGGGLNIGQTLVTLALHATRDDAPAATRIERRTWILGSRVALPAGQLLVSYQASDDRSTVNADVRNIAATYEYPLSRRTVAYATAGKNFNNDAAAVALYQTPSGATLSGGYDPTAFAIGFRHSF